MDVAGLREVRDGLIVRFAAALLVAFAAMAVHVWCAGQGLTAASVTALVTFGLTSVYAIIVWAWTVSVWLRIREARRIGA